MAVTDLNEQVSVQAVSLLRALEHVRPELVVLTEKELLAVNLDPLASVAIARGALPALRGLCLQVNGERKLNEDRLSQLELYAFALIQAHITYKLTSRRTRDLQELGAVANQLDCAMKCPSGPPKLPMFAGAHILCSCALMMRCVELSATCVGTKGTRTASLHPSTPNGRPRDDAGRNPL
jgi:hypothetical protein